MIFCTYILIGILAIVMFFVIFIKNKHHKKKMDQENQWMQSLSPEEWGNNEENEKDNDC
jgi:hypothetical protein